MIKRLITTVEELQEPNGTIRINTPLMCYVFEQLRKTSDLDSYKTMMLCERLSQLSGNGKILTMEDKDSILNGILQPIPLPVVPPLTPIIDTANVCVTTDTTSLKSNLTIDGRTVN